MTFSQRQGLELHKILQDESIDDALKNSLWNVLAEYYFKQTDNQNSGVWADDLQYDVERDLRLCQRTAQETLHHHVEVLADARHLALGDAIASQRLDQVVHPPCGYPFHVGLLDDRQQSSLAATPWLQQAREVAPLSELRDVVEGFLGRPLDGGPYPYPYLWLDALTQKVREDGRIVNVSVVVATAVNGEGKREIIGMDVGTSEDGAFWLAFLRSLSARGLGGVELVVSDAHQGLRGAIAAVFGGASWQRCRTHFMTNLLTRVPRRAQPWVATMVRTIYQQPSPDEVHAQLDRVTSQLQDRFPQVASLLDEAGPDILAFSSFPVSHWKKLWSNNPPERLNKEIRRRTDVVGIFPNRPAVRRLVGAVLDEQHDEWAVGRRYLTPAILTFNEALPEADVAEDTAA